jgi:hypothetical protein
MGTKTKSQSGQNIPSAQTRCCEALAWADQVDPTATARPSTRVLARVVASGSRKGEPPLCQKLSSEKFFLLKKLSCISTALITESKRRARETLNGKADRAEGLLRLRDTDTSLITFRER